MRYKTIGTVRTISNSSSDYPKKLAQISSPPKLLYISGKMPNKEDKCLAIVGTRRYSDYGKRAVLEIAGDLVNAGITIISGLARGIDTFAHKAALERNGKTIAVLGSGIDSQSFYPKENLKLAKEILNKGGAIISEYVLGTTAFSYHFPERNRIIAGLSSAVIVIEAKEKSGALITANCAFQQKKEVFCLPGSIYSSNSQGPHSLIQRGAKLITSANDILRWMKLPLKLNIKFKKGENMQEDLILKTLAGEALHIDKIIEQTKLDVAVIGSTLIVLEIKNRIKNLGGNIWTINKA